MINEIPLCTSCAQVISNPICPKCFARHVEYWVKDRNVSNTNVKKISWQLSRIVHEATETPTEMSCIFCGMETVNLCTYCFVKKVERVIGRNINNEEAVNEFKEDFNPAIWDIQV